MIERPQTVTAADYARIFAEERRREYPVIDALEDRLGFAIDRAQLEEMARVLACPLKANPPNWQHGRVIYAAACRALRSAIYGGQGASPVLLLDIGTAKGFSALMLRWALRDVGLPGRVVSIDVIDPLAPVRRNTVAEVDGLKTLAETLAPWHEAQAIEFVQSDGRKWLTKHPERVHVAVVDGKHTYEAVSWEASLLSARQQTGDVVIFDDLQIPPVANAVMELRDYAIEFLAAKPERVYAVGRKR